MLFLWFCFDRELELEWLIFLSIYDDFLVIFRLKKFNLLYFCRQCWKCWTKSVAGEDKPPDREWLCFEMVGEFWSFLKLTPSKHSLWPTHIRRKPNHCKTHLIYIVQVRKFLSLICLYVQAKYEALARNPYCSGAKNRSLKHRSVGLAVLWFNPQEIACVPHWVSLPSFQQKQWQKKNNFAWNFWGPCDRKYWLGICPKEWDGLTQCNETNSINMGPKGKISWSKPNKFPY